MTRFLLTGANGQLGFELKRSLSLYGEVVAVTREDCDLSDAGAIRALVHDVRPTVIVNPAAYTAVDKAESEPELAYAINRDAPAILAECARELNALLVHYSTDYVFDGTGDSARDEDAATAPCNIYGRSKRDGEQAVIQQLRNNASPYYILRTSWVFGTYGNNFLKTMLRLAQSLDSLSIVDDQIGAPTSAAMLADLTGLLLLRRPASGLYHATAAGEVSWHGFARHIIQRAQQAGLDLKVSADHLRKLRTSEYPAIAARPLNSRLDTKKLAHALGIDFPHWTLGVDQAISTLVQNRELLV